MGNNIFNTLSDYHTPQNLLPDPSESHQRIQLPDGSIYKGETLNNEPQGQGIRYYPDGSRYEGGLNEGKREGVGSQRWKDERKYQGEWKNDKIEGKGKINYPDYSYYRGEWKENKKEGEGYQEWWDGFYQGSWKNDEQNIGMNCFFGGGGDSSQCPGY